MLAIFWVMSFQERLIKDEEKKELSWHNVTRRHLVMPMPAATLLPLYSTSFNWSYICPRQGEAHLGQDCYHMLSVSVSVQLFQHTSKAIIQASSELETLCSMCLLLSLQHHFKRDCGEWELDCASSLSEWRPLPYPCPLWWKLLFSSEIRQ